MTISDYARVFKDTVHIIHLLILTESKSSQLSCILVYSPRINSINNVSFFNFTNLGFKNSSDFQFLCTVNQDQVDQILAYLLFFEMSF